MELYWQFIVLRTDEEKEYAFSEAKAIADKFNADRYLNMPRPYPITLGQKCTVMPCRNNIPC